MTLKEVSIKCRAIGAGHVNIDYKEQPLLTPADGPMPPGLTKSMKIRLERGEFAVKEMQCLAHGR
jgi:hypothetical protein